MAIGTGRTGGAEGAVDAAAAPTASTRERILDVALELFTEQGYDATTLREIAERLGVTKAALYYHFESKEDILLALHLRVHAFGRQALARLRTGPVTLALWAELLDEVLDQLLSQRQLFLMHERNQAAVEKLHRSEHDAEHDDIRDMFLEVLRDEAIPLADRVRMACSFGAVFAGLFFASDTLGSTSDDELGRLVRDALHDLLDR